MTDPARGPTTEELRARVLAQTTTEGSAKMRYCVNATITAPAWIYVEADSEDAARAEAATIPARDYECDMSAAGVEFNVTPDVEVAA